MITQETLLLLKWQHFGVFSNKGSVCVNVVCLTLKAKNKLRMQHEKKNELDSSLWFILQLINNVIDLPIYGFLNRND